MTAVLLQGPAQLDPGDQPNGNGQAIIDWGIDVEVPARIVAITAGFTTIDGPSRSMVNDDSP